MDEWRLYAVDEIPKDWYSADLPDDCAERTLNLPRIDCYWAKVMIMRNAAGDTKYGTRGKAVSACLALAHGNADVERGFFLNKQLVRPDRCSLDPETINAVRMVKDALRCHAQGSAVNMAVTLL
jgi:hypothetical protein